MKYTEVWTKRAEVTTEERQEAAKSDEFQEAFNQAYAKGGPLHHYATRVSPGEIMRIALGATAGGGLGWLVSRLLHRKPKTWRTLLYTIGGATAGGLGTHWYINRPDKDGKTIAQQARRHAALGDPKTQKFLTDIAKAKKDIPEQPDTENSNVARTFDALGWNFDARGNIAGAEGAGVGFLGGGFGTQAIINWRQGRKIKALNTAINNVNSMELAGTPLTNSQAKHFIHRNGATKRNGYQSVLFDVNAPPGRRFTLNPDALDDLQVPTLNYKGQKKRFSVAGGLVTAPIGFAVGQWIDNKRRAEENERATDSIEEATRRFLEDRQKK